MINYIFNVRGTIIKINIDEFSGFRQQPWFLANLVSYYCDKDNNPIDIDEAPDVVKSIIESLRFRRLILYPHIDINHFYALCDKWCVPRWLIDTTNKERHPNEIKSIVAKFIHTALNHPIKE